MPSSSSRSSTHRGKHGKSSSSSSSSHKRSSKATSKPSNSVVKASEQDIYHQENAFLWQDVKSTEGNPSALVLALVAPEQRKAMKKLIDDKVKKKKIRSSVIVTTQDQLQEHLGSAMTNSIASKKAFKTLHLLVSSTVAQLTYNIEGFVDQVFIRPCGAGGRPDALRIGSSSTYCGFKTYAWDARPYHLQQSNKELTHLEGCNFDISDCSQEAIRLLQQPREAGDLSHDEKYNVMQKFQELRDTEVSENARDPSNSCADGTETWFQKWKGLLATVMAAGAGAAGMASGFWMSAGGVMVKGPYGLYLAAGYATVGGFGAVGAAGTGSAVAAYGMVYFIPWDRVWDLLREKLWQIWDKIWEVLVWIKDKLAELASTVLTKVSLLVQGAPKPARLSM
ncbi:hypothetical protein ACKRZS_011837 [Fusarium odoratissimum]|uniref:Uncharacterized protein n=2 Tax=Fusarium oxysporum species complex TaxID=171631 RepID=X0JAV5_FUSO5|nr:uncharacterized protein FOIG_09868 [Fusarium odoratissimum NRRL 54006]EXL98318.1 hypothetical protein FOIG_09868 [Fusarium odoratissimum NRRL 54006]KAK2124012.1 hypothetical protein NOF04DRAFT_6728 [Fusarium oxysporum II5]TXB95509.1 hypothetical protein FocTR4_00016461 [Fusarium oxysporum f. sp. cubense]